MEMTEVEEKIATGPSSVVEKNIDGTTTFSYPQTVINGLKLKRKDSSLPFKTFHYTPAILYGPELLATDWCLLSPNHIVVDHIRIHKLKKEGDDLIGSVESYRRDHAKAVIVINHTEETVLPPVVCQCLQKLSDFLVGVLPFSEGMSLLDCVQEDEDNELCARLDVVGSETIPVPSGEDSDTISFCSQQQISVSSHKGINLQRSSIKFFGKPLFHLKSEIKKFMFDGDQMLPISTDSSRVVIIMANFDQFERQGKPDSNHIGKLIKKFNRHMHRLGEEFPFFLCLAYRFLKFHHVYNCEELDPFIAKCINVFESTSPDEIAKTLLLFLKNKDFDVMFGNVQEAMANISVFILLADACKNLMMYNQQSIVSKRTMYCRILWISVYLKCLSEKGIVTKKDLAIWNTNLIAKVRMTSDITRNMIEDFRSGLELSAMLLLPEEYQITVYNLLLANGKFIRPLSHIRDIMVALRDFIKTGELLNIMVSLRTHNKFLLSDHSNGSAAVASVNRTIQGTIDEGIAFLDSAAELLIEKKWNKGEENEKFSTECVKWIILFLDTVHLSNPDAPQLLKKFLLPRKSSVTAKYRKHIVQHVLEKTRNNFSKLSIQTFTHLYQIDKIWSIQFLHDFLKLYDVPINVNIGDAIWSELFSEVLSRHFSDELQGYILDFVVKVANTYTKGQRSWDFIPHILQLKVPNLFSSSTEPGIDKLKKCLIKDRFADFLTEYIRRNILCHVIMEKIQEILKLVSKNIQFHWTVLNVMQTEIIPELKSLQDGRKESMQFLDLLEEFIKKIDIQKISGTLSPCQSFYWGVISALCEKLPTSEKSFEWVFTFQPVITKLGSLFNAYCISRKLFIQQCPLSENLPQEIMNCQCESIRHFFQWIREVQDILRIWEKKLIDNEVNYNEIMTYANHRGSIDCLSQTVHAKKYVVDTQAVEKIRKAFTSCYDLLNHCLIRYVCNHAELKYCNLPELLLSYGVSFPPELRNDLEHKVIFPGSKHNFPDEQCQNAIPASADGKFDSGQNIFLTINKSLSLCKLQKLLENLQNFLEPIDDHHMKMFVFFHLQKSDMFDKHLRRHLDAAAPPKPTSNALLFKQSLEGISMDVLQNALSKVNDLLFKIIRGTATYSEIVANGALQLQTLDTEKEFGRLRTFVDLFKMNKDDCEGLDGMRNMLELFQFTHHIDQIWKVCEQYGLIKCLEDEQLKKLKLIVKQFKTETSRANLTPLEATAKMIFIKHALCLEGCTDYNCLKLFPAVADSAVFHQFIRDKQFVGHKGQELFREQYQLITAQLQHEEYDENVLNHLRATFELMIIAPFMERDISFYDLMKKVTKLDITNGLKQLETVNENIALIIQWFSRAEGDTREDVANQLQHILNTGVYQFQLGSQFNTLLIYQTMLSGLTHQKSADNLVERCNRDRTSTELKKESKGIEQRWNNEQIADFVRKLGFLDIKRKGKDVIKKFLHLNSTANKLMGLYMKLYELGHPHYQKHTNLPSLQCNVSAAEANEMVDNLQKLSVKWREQVESLRREYTWLLFFSIPKSLHLYSLLDDSDFDLSAIINEVSFLFENSALVCKKLEGVVKSSFEEASQLTSREAPMEFLGKFLQLVCESTELEPHLLKERNSSSKQIKTLDFPPITLSAALASDVFQLHYTPGYSQCQLIRLISHLYGGVPECYEVLHCKPSTTAEELTIFMERVKHHPLTYLVLLVNDLSYKQQELLLTLLKNISFPDQSSLDKLSTVHFIETTPSILREVSFITYHEHKDGESDLSFEETSCLFKKIVLNSSDFSHDIVMVFGNAGDGKTHYIRKHLAKSPAKLTIAINEAFTPLNTIKRLLELSNSASKYVIFFNFTINFHLDSIDEQKKAKEFLDTIGWFFYHLLVLGYVEDPATGASYRLPSGQGWTIFVEVPSFDHSHQPEESLRLFKTKIPTLGLLGSHYEIKSDTPYTVDEDVQLVCKYLRAYEIGGAKGIDRLYKDKHSKKVRFGDDRDLSDEECHQLLQKYMPKHIQETKISQRLFIRYMKRRCDFLEDNPAFNYNTGVGEPLTDEQGKKYKTDTRQLGSTIMETMLEEVSNFCDPDVRRNWSSKPHQQLIYDRGGSFGLVSLQPENMPENRKKKYEKIGFEITSDLQDLKVLHKLLSRAFSLPFEDKPLSIFDDCNYVLTLDYTIKMLNIHERHCCGVPVIIKGETGVGKTALVDMLSQLWNIGLLHIWNWERDRIINAIKDLKDLRKATNSLDDYHTCSKIVEAITAGNDVSINNLIALGQLNDKDPSKGEFHHRLREILMDMEKDPASALLEIPVNERREYGPINKLFYNTKKDFSVQGTAVLLQAILRAKIKTTFYKLNMHAAFTPSDIKTFFKPIFEQANYLRKSYNNTEEPKRTKINKIPYVTVFLDEVNTSSCLGLVKELIIDKTLDGKAIPENVFIVAACNPHRGNSMATHAAETWLRSSYFVRPLHPTLEYLMWDYGSLDQYQERDYISAKLKMLHKELPNIEVVALSDLIVKSQNLMREFALYQLMLSDKMELKDAKVSSQSCVSQRDIQRVFTFYQWLISVYYNCKERKDQENSSWRAMMVSLGLVYYLRLNNKYREKYEEVLNSHKNRLPGEVTFSQAFNEELDFFCNHIELPSGISKTRALKENLFATIVCTVTRTPLIIVGAPGSSKTLSFNLAITNLKGLESKVEMFRNVEIFKSLDPHYYQCSRRTTSNEIQTVFSRAINRQRSHTKFSLPIYCVVLMDEAGLPEESHESLKVLHYHLDKQEVSFVAITNHVLDASKTNRAVSVFRPEMSAEGLKTLAKGCFCPNPDNPPVNLRQDLQTIVQFCPVYLYLMEDPKFKKFFGLRDFIHFINYLRRKRTTGINSQLVVEALERNFNGIFWSNCQELVGSFFLNCMSNQTDENEIRVKWRSVLEVFKESFEDHNSEGGRDENEVRYKLVIDPTEDNSLMHLLIAFGMLERAKTRIYVCSGFLGDSHIQKINTIAAIRQSAIEGHTVIMSQTDDIHESFYDLFNQRFRKIDDPEHGPCYYANIAIGAHLKPCRVHPDFVCVVVVKQTEIESTPGPFLNRFEKYFISHEILLNMAFKHLKPCVRIVLQTALEKVNKFIDVIGRDNNALYGLKKHTLISLLLSLLPPYGHIYQPTHPGEPFSKDPKECLLHELLRALRSSAGFAIPAYLREELETDARYLFSLLKKDASFEAVLRALTVESANDAVNEALQVLHTASDAKNEGTMMSQRACLVVSVLQQWLIRHVCKTLMQLMTPEAICLHRKKIPASLINNYLVYQQHFNLKKLLDHHLLALQFCTNDTTLQYPNKLLCFTRSSSIIHHLPSNYPNSGGFQSSDEEIACLKELVHDDPAQIQVCKVVSIQSQTAIQDTLRDFSLGERKIILLLVNMQEATIEMINHLRIMMEEAEFQFSSTSKKLFVLVLHFPVAMFFYSCYPSLFLRGWNHYYLDSIGHCPTLNPGRLDIEKWLQKCCFPKQKFDEDNLVEVCNHLLKEVLPALTSRITFCNMKPTERSAKLKELLWDKGLGLKLCEMFRSCWTPPVMTEHLERAAKLTQTREPSLNITDAIQTMFQSSFTDFMIFMVAKIKFECNLDVLFIDKSSKLIDKLFLELMGTVIPPKPAQLKSPGSMDGPNQLQYRPMFPFFSMVYKCMEQLIEESHKTKVMQDNMFEKKVDEDSPISVGTEIDLSELILSTIEDRLKGDNATHSDPLLITVRYIQDHSDSIWNNYFADFVHRTLHLDMFSSSLSREVINAFFSDILSLQPLQRFVYLHLYVRYNHVNLANICSLLLPLGEIWEVAADSHCSLISSGSSPAKDLINVIKQTNEPFGDPVLLSTFVISVLFSTLVRSQDEDAIPKTQNSILKLWYTTYHHRVMSIMTLKSHLYNTSLPEYEEAKFNAMHVTFSLMRAYPKLNKDALTKGSSVFNTLLDQYFEKNLQLKDPKIIPNFSECVIIVDQLMTDCSKDTEDYLRLVHEELFEHFLSRKRMVSAEDRLWFLRLANGQCMEKIECVSMAVYKKHLAQLLSRKTNDNTVTKSNPLMLYNAEARQSVAQVLSVMENGKDPCPYIPSFYKDCCKGSRHSENLLMQQPLCHLYFATLMEHLMDEPIQHDVNSLVRLAVTITQLEPVQVGEKIILQIERQAVIQCLLQQLASVFSDDKHQILFPKKLEPVLVELNSILNDNDTGGGASGGHLLVLGMHLLRQLKSYWSFIDLFTNRYTMVKKVQCLSSFHEQFKVFQDQQDMSEPFLLPFMENKDHGSVLGKLFRQVKDAMLNVDTSKADSLAAVDQLVKVADNCFSNKFKSDLMTKRQVFKMIVWLVSYYEFFAKKKPSQYLNQVVRQKLHEYIQDESVICLIQCFFDPQQLEESQFSNSSREDVQTYLADGNTDKVNYGGRKTGLLNDPFFQLSQDESSNKHFCHCLANLVGVVLGRQPHLLFSPDELKDTMTTFMFNCPEGLPLYYKVDLIPDDQYSCSNYQTHEIYSLHSLYFLLWANFGVFFVSVMLTQLNSQSNLSEWQAIRDYCLSQMKTLWVNLQDNLGLSDEERSFLLTRCLMNLYQAIDNDQSSNMEGPASMLGKLKTKNDLAKYETFWYKSIFKPALQELKKYSVEWRNNKVFENIHNLEKYYPLYPSEKDFLIYLYGLQVTDSSWKLVLRFAKEKQRLEVGGKLLPCLLQLYHWLHTHLAHLLTSERACELKIGQVIELASCRVDPSLKELYNRVKGLYNKYVELVDGGIIGQEVSTAVKRGNKIYAIDDDLPLIHFLSDLEQEGEGRDRLFAVVRDIAKTQNQFVHSLYTTVGNMEEGEHPLARLLTPKQLNIFLVEANEYNCLVGAEQKTHGISTFIQLIRARLDLTVGYHLTSTPLNTPSKTMFLSPKRCPFMSCNLTHLQEDIVNHYLTGKPIIRDIESSRIIFKFKKPIAAASESNPIDYAVADVSVIRNTLPDVWQMQPLESQFIRSLTCEFHSTSYLVLTDVVNGLKTAIGFLTKAVSKDSMPPIGDMDLYHLIVSQYEIDDTDDNQCQALSKIGIRNLTNTQVRCLSSTKLPFLFQTLVFFVDWIRDGLCDFSSLPLVLKAHLQEADLLVLNQLPMKYPGAGSRLLSELKRLINTLQHSEQHLLNEFNAVAKKSLISVLDGMQLVSDTEQLPKLIPQTVLVHHYVQFRIVLKKLTLVVENKLATETVLHDWNELVDNLWSEALPHLRDQSFVSVYPTHMPEDYYSFKGENSDKDVDSSECKDLNKSLFEESLQSQSLDFDDPLLYMVYEEATYNSFTTIKTPASSIAPPSSSSFTTVTPETLISTPSSSSTTSDLKNGLQDPKINRKDIKQQAKNWSYQMVAEFLKDMGKKSYTEAFLEQEIDGLQLLIANREVFIELGVESSIECAQIAVSFKRKLMGVASISCLTIPELLEKGGKKLDKYEKNLNDAGVDVDMLVYASQSDFLDDLLKDVGVSSAVDRNKFRAALSNDCSDFMGNTNDV